MDEMTDKDRADFLAMLDDTDKVSVTDWEANFIASNLSRSTFTPSQRDAIDVMVDRYAKKIGF